MKITNITDTKTPPVGKRLEDLPNGWYVAEHRRNLIVQKTSQDYYVMFDLEISTVCVMRADCFCAKYLPFTGTLTLQVP